MGVRGWGKRGCFFQRIQILRKEFFFLFFLEGVGLVGRGEWGWGRGVDGWSDEQAQTNSLLQILRSWGHNNALM